eukprot:CAMPEP_0170752886 /NCGR_PEP_ID=MMETSP0437-20130122/12201_1 /TAXON_ID=0 /ORGANISM="Sexangularia sp." /LENGTH=47 /DNA_ID= /DNA_START= /DNA_END= /DNA_ORIENTATION=
MEKKVSSEARYDCSVVTSSARMRCSRGGGSHGAHGADEEGHSATLDD